MMFTLIVIIIILVILFKIFFERQPDRNIPIEGIVSPASGKVVRIIRYDNIDEVKLRKGLLGKLRVFTGFQKDGIIISIMMNILDVHVQRAPTNGRVISIKHNPGKFINAVKQPEKMEWLVNENIETLIQTRYGQIKVLQIAGVFARRCISLLKTNQKIIKGQRMGIIKWGSQVTIILPAALSLKVREGNRVVDGETVIAK